MESNYTSFEALALEVLSLPSQHAARAYILRQLDPKFTKVDRLGNIFFDATPGVPKPFLVAHMDTVHAEFDAPLVLKKDKKTGRWQGFDPANPNELCGIGGDDKCGIAAALALHLMDYPCGLAFFSDEETGCIGSGDCDHGNFVDATMLVQFDRRGKEDAIRYTNGNCCWSEEFEKFFLPIVQEHGFKRSDGGSVTDVGKLVDDGIGICAVNMASGYYDAHQTKESVDIADLWNGVVAISHVLVADGASKVWVLSKADRDRIDDERYSDSYSNYYRSMTTGGTHTGRWTPKSELGKTLWPDNYDIYADAHDALKANDAAVKEIQKGSSIASPEYALDTGKYVLLPNGHYEAAKEFLAGHYIPIKGLVFRSPVFKGKFLSAIYAEGPGGTLFDLRFLESVNSKAGCIAYVTLSDTPGMMAVKRAIDAKAKAESKAKATTIPNTTTTTAAA